MPLAIEKHIHVKHTHQTEGSTEVDPGMCVPSPQSLQCLGASGTLCEPIWAWGQPSLSEIIPPLVRSSFP